VGLYELLEAIPEVHCRFAQATYGRLPPRTRVRRLWLAAQGRRQLLGFYISTYMYPVHSARGRRQEPGPEGFIRHVPGMNPVGLGPNSNKGSVALSKLKWMVGWRNIGPRGHLLEVFRRRLRSLPPSAIAAEVFLLPAGDRSPIGLNLHQLRALAAMEMEGHRSPGATKVTMRSCFRLFLAVARSVTSPRGAASSPSRS